MTAAADDYEDSHALRISGETERNVTVQVSHRQHLIVAASEDRCSDSSGSRTLPRCFKMVMQQLIESISGQYYVDNPNIVELVTDI